MRNELKKLTRGHSTKAERRFAELLKKTHIPFQTKVKIRGHEVDFLIGRYAIEIAGHNQNVIKNIDLVEAGYAPIFIYNYDVTSTRIEWLKKLYLYAR